MAGYNELMVFESLSFNTAFELELVESSKEKLLLSLELAANVPSPLDVVANGVEVLVFNNPRFLAAAPLGTMHPPVISSTTHISGHFW